MWFTTLTPPSSTVAPTQVTGVAAVSAPKIYPLRKTFFVVTNGLSSVTATTTPTIPVSQQEYKSAGTYNWTCPAGVLVVSAVCIGGGGGGGSYWTYGGGGGGGCGWKNNIPVVPGQTYTVVVGSAGPASQNAASGNGGTSYFISTSTVAGYGGGDYYNSTGGPNANNTQCGYGGGYFGDGGGAGGSASASYGGAGAAGYTGQGGNSYNGGPTSGSGGAYSGGSYSSTYGTGSGGGIDVYGKGSDGTGNYTPWSGWTTGSPGGGGMGGSGGSMGAYGENPWSGPGNYGPAGGNYGGGGGAPGTSWPGGPGGVGSVRILWGGSCSFTSTTVTTDQTWNTDSPVQVSYNATISNFSGRQYPATRTADNA